MPEVYRVENDDQLGPFSWLPQWMLPRDLMQAFQDAMGSVSDSDLHTSRNKYPLPEDDGIEMTDDYHCGCKDCEQVKYWFHTNDLLLALERYGFHIAEYRVPDGDVKFGQHQVAFRKEDAKLIKKIKPSKLIDNPHTKRLQHV